MDRDMYYGGQCPVCGGGLSANHGLKCKGMYADKPPDMVLVRREDLIVALDWLDRLAIFQALHVPCEPVPELVNATSRLKAALEGEKP